MKLGIKHLIECHCTLKIYTGGDKQIYHKIPVYSKTCQKTNKVLEKIVKCNNCSTLHKVYDICKSSIFNPGKDTSFMLVDIEDIDLELSEKVSKILKKYDADLATWEQVLDILTEDHDQFPQNVILRREINEGKYHVKCLVIESKDKFKIKSSVIKDEIVYGKEEF